MKNNIFLIFVIVLFGSCQNSQDVAFNALVESIEKNEKIHFPIEAIKKEPFYKVIPVELFQTKDSTFSLNHYQKMVDDLSKFNSERLTEQNQVVLKSLNPFFKHKINALEKGEAGHFFSILSILKQDVKNESQTNEEQFEKIIQGLAEVPKYFSVAKIDIKNPDKEQLQNAVKALSNDYFFIKNDLPTLIRKPDILKDAQINFANKNQKAQIAIKDYLAFLNSQLFELGDSI